MVGMIHFEINFISFVLLLTVAIKTLRTRTFKKARTKYFSGSVLFAAMANILSVGWNMGISGYRAICSTVMWGIGFFYFISICASSYCWLLYTEITFKCKGISKQLRFCYALPLLIVGGSLVISYFTGWVFYFDANGIYHKGILFNIQYLLAYTDFFVSSILCICRALTAELVGRKDELLSMASFIIPPIVCAAVQHLIQGIPLLSVGIAFSYVLAFVNALEHMVTSDELTGIFNRSELLNRLSKKINSLKFGETFYFLFMDIDSFKRINDTYGHDEGDRILQALAAALKKVSTETGGICGRYGGDEFALFIACNENDILRIKNRVFELIKQISSEKGIAYPLSVSIGCAYYNTKMRDAHAFVAAADANMYECKNNRRKPCYANTVFQSNRCSHNKEGM